MKHPFEHQETVVSVFVIMFAYFPVSFCSLVYLSGRIHDQSLAYELMGDYLSSILEIPQATECYKRAHKCYMQWGAVAKANKIQEDHQLDLEGGEIENNQMKHGRD